MGDVRPERTDGQAPAPGAITHAELLEAIAGDLPEDGDEGSEAGNLEDGSFLLHGAMSIHDAQQRLDLRELPEGEFHTVAGFVVFLFGKLPQTGERAEWGEWAFEVHDVQHLRVAKVRARRLAAPS